MRIIALTTLVCVLGACAGKVPAQSTTRSSVASLPDSPLPEGWWVETSDETNAKDVGSGAHFQAEGATIALPDGRVDRPPLRLRKIAPRTWEIDIGEAKAMVVQTADGGLVIDKAGKRITFRPATSSESQGFEARAARPSD